MLIVVTLTEQNQRLDLFYKSTFMFFHVRFTCVFGMMESLQVLSDSLPKYENCSFMFHRKKKDKMKCNTFLNRLLTDYYRLLTMKDVVCLLEISHSYLMSQFSKFS